MNLNNTPLPSKFYQQNVYICWADAWNSWCLTDGLRTNFGKFLACLNRQCVHLAEVKTIGNDDIFQSAQLLGKQFFALYVAAIFNLYLRLLDNFGCDVVRLDKFFHSWQSLDKLRK